MNRILMVAYTHYLTDARPRRAAETLVSRGDQVEFIALAEPGRPSTEYVKGVRVLRIPQSRFRGGSTLRYIYGYGIFFLRAFLKVTRLFFTKRYNVVYVHTMPDWMVFVGLIPKLYGVKIILDMHDMMPELYMSKFGAGEKSFLIRLMKLQERMSFTFADRIICVHQPHLEVLMRRGAEKKRMTVLLNLPDPTIFGEHANSECHASSGAPRLVYHGTIAERLGLDIALKSFRQVQRQIPGARFDIYGDGDFSDHLAELIDEFGLRNSVYFSKKMFRVDEVPALIKGASIGIISNRKDIATEYMLPVKMIEYLHLGIPVVAPKLATISHYFGEDEVAFYEPGDVDQLAQRIIELSLNESKRIEYVEHARRFLSRYSWKNLQSELFNVIDN